MAHAKASMDELRTIWEQRGIDETQIEVDHKGTILGDASMLTAPLAWSSLVSELPEATPEHGPLVVLGSELGRGAMGVVHTGTQRSLGREVAIKSPRGGAPATQALLREAASSERPGRSLSMSAIRCAFGGRCATLSGCSRSIFAQSCSQYARS